MYSVRACQVCRRHNHKSLYALRRAALRFTYQSPAPVARLIRAVLFYAIYLNRNYRQFAQVGAPQFHHPCKAFQIVLRLLLCIGIGTTLIPQNAAYRPNDVYAPQHSSI